MREYLVFRLYGPMASWGDIAVGEYRPSYAHPSKSAVLGLIAAAAGVRREPEDEAVHRELANAYGFAVRVDSPGVLLRDYHTAQVPSSKKERSTTRWEELSVGREDLNTILSSRDYRCDAVYTICLWPRNASPPYSLRDLAEKLRNPSFTLYLGRKSCPLALPLQPRLVEAGNVRQAFDRSEFKDRDDLRKIPREKSTRVYWEGGDDSGYLRIHTVTRRDAPLSRRRWQYADREEHYGIAESTEPSREE